MSWFTTVLSLAILTALLDWTGALLEVVSFFQLPRYGSDFQIIHFSGTLITLITIYVVSLYKTEPLYYNWHLKTS